MDAIHVTVDELAEVIRSRTDNSDDVSARLAARIIAGAEWLDRQWPSWEWSVDVPLIEMTSHCNCVLGQIVGSYQACDAMDWDGWFGNPTNPHYTENLGLRQAAETNEVTLDRTEAVERGFHLGNGASLGDEWLGLTEGWKHLILQRVDPAPF